MLSDDCSVDRSGLLILEGDSFAPECGSAGLKSWSKWHQIWNPQGPRW